MRALAAQLAADPEIAAVVNVVVVVDGSTDGSAELAEVLPMPVPVEVVWQENRGLAAARNAGLAAATGELVLFLDDDLVPEPGLVRRHVLAHVDDTPTVLVGPCVLPPDGPSHASIAAWWDARYAELSASGISHFGLFSAANTSFPVELLRSVGGFDERFRGYGMEDYELALRLLDNDVAIAFDPMAVAGHERRHSLLDQGRLRTQEGVNAVRFARIHPDRVDEIVDTNPPTQWSRRLHRVGIRRAWMLRLVWRLALAMIPVQAKLDPKRRLHALFLADAAAFCAGVVSTGDREMYDRFVTGRR